MKNIMDKTNEQVILEDTLLEPKKEVVLEDALIHAKKGISLYKEQQYKEALEEYKLSLEYDPNNKHALYNMGSCLEKMKEYEKARDTFNQVLSIDPNHEKAKRKKTLVENEIKIKQEEMVGKLKDMGKEVGNKFLGLFGMSVDNFEMKQDPSSGSYSIQMKNTQNK